MSNLCECGCGREVRNRFIRGHQNIGRSGYWLGKNRSIETKEKISKANIGKKLSIETIKKMSESRKGINNHFYGKHHDEETKLRISIGHKGKIYSSRGISKVHSGSFKKGRKVSEELKRKISLRSKGKKYPKELFPDYGMRNKKHTKEAIEKMKETWNTPDKIEYAKQRRAKIISPTKDTSIEIKIQSFLKQLNINFLTHQYIKDIEHGYQCDIYIPIQKGINKKTIIECFGNYWHSYPIGREIDSTRCQELRAKGFRVLVFWEHEIKVMELNDLKEKL